MAKTNAPKIETKLEELTEEVRNLRAMLARGTRNNLPRLTVDNGQIVLKDIQSHPGTARKEIVERTNLTPLQVTKIVGDLQHQEQLVKVGDRKTTRWFTPESLQALTKAAGVTKAR